MTRGLGIIGLDAIVTYTHDLERSRRFYVEQFDLVESARSSPVLEVQGGQRGAAFQAGEVTIYAHEPVATHSRAGRFLASNPAGVGALVFEVADAQAAFEELEARGASPTGEVVSHHDVQGVLRTFSITTPLGATTFRFVERRGYLGLRPGFIPLDNRGPSNRFKVVCFDSVSAHFETMKPALLWLEHVLGFEPLRPSGGPEARGGRLHQVMREPESGVLLVASEPERTSPYGGLSLRQAQSLEREGIAEVALRVRDITRAVSGLRHQDVRFEGRHDAASALPGALLEVLGLDLRELHALDIAASREGDGACRLHIRVEEGARYHEDALGGSFAYELVERRARTESWHLPTVEAPLMRPRPAVYVSGGPY